MPETKNNDSEIIIAHNKEEWGRLLFLLQDPKPNVFWINCDSERLKKPLHDALTEHLPKLKSFDIDINDKTESLNRIILGKGKNKIPPNAIIHVFGLENAVKNSDFIGNLNFQRDNLFRETPVHIIFWADFATSTILTHKAYDFWSWVVFTFDFKTPEGLLTSRQKGFQQELILGNTTIPLLNKDSQARIRHLEDEWEEFLRSVNGKPSTVKQMKDAVTIVSALANEYKDEGEYHKTVNVLQKILFLNPELLDADSNNTIINSLSTAYYNLGELEKAKELGEKVLSDTIKQYGEEYIELSTLQSNLALVYWDLKDFSKAKELMEKALETNIMVFGENHSIVGISQSNLAMIYQDFGDLDKAKELMEKALDINIKSFGEYHPEVAISQSNLATIYWDLGDLDKARKLLEQALNIDLENFGKFHPNVAIRYNNLAYIYYSLRLLQKAKEYIQEAYEINKKVLGEDNPKTLNCLNFLKSLTQNEPRPTP